LFYGQRDDPLAALSRLGRQLEVTATPEIVLPTLVETIAHTLKLPYVALSLRSGTEFRIAAQTGKKAARALRLPLSDQGETMGELIVAPRAAGESFTELDQRLLETIAYQAGPAVHAVQLMADLRRSRLLLVTAREEERRRLRRDLHDGLGPQLASQTLTIDAITKLLTRDPQRAEALLQELKAQAQTAVEEIRRLVYDLRPPALDELGLAGALKEQAARRCHNGLHIALELPDRLPPVPAAVEVAVYRIALEALNNVTRHAHARHCYLRLCLENSRQPPYLRLEIGDDGRGLPDDLRAGVGFYSMRERAAELDGTLEITGAAGGGTRVQVSLPIVN
jgi:signal transduction histidine kinase